MALHQVVITDCDHADINEETKVFTEAGISFYRADCKTEEECIAACQGVPVCLHQYVPLTEKFFAALPQLKLVAQYGVGVDRIDLDAATRHHVQICNVPDYGTFEVADHALALFMELNRRVGLCDKLVKSGVWDYSKAAPLRRLSTLSVGVVGLGRIGQAFARRVHALGCRVLGYDVYTKHIESNPELSFIELMPKDELLSRADVISLHCGLSAENRNFISAASIRKMKDGAQVINVARGGLVEEADLAAALTSGKLSGAALDVTVQEPLEADSPLRRAPHLIITPHLAWYSEQAARDLARKCAEEAVRAIRGEKPRCPVNKL